MTKEEYDAPREKDEISNSNGETENDGQDDDVGVCCFFLKFGTCNPPRPPCRWRHDVIDDGNVVCCFGATCRVGHAKRVLGKDHNNLQIRQMHWKALNSKDDAIIGANPAERDAKLLRSQLEPWSTGVLRERLATVFGEDHRSLEFENRGKVMRRLLDHYETSGMLPRQVIRVEGTPIRDELQRDLLVELEKWRHSHKINTRPSLKASSYMVLASPRDFEGKESRKARKAATKFARNRRLWELASIAIQEVDPDFGANFTSLAITHGFIGSPHIDKQDTGPFYGLALGNHPDGQGELCVEATPQTVAIVNTKNRIGKVDGRFPHWVSFYDTSMYDRYSLIFYSTLQTYAPPTTAYFGEPTNK